MRLQPLTFGLFEKRIQGDDCLLELAQERFKKAGMGAEFHADTPEQLDGQLKFRPSPCSMLHLPRQVDLADATSQRLILEFAARHAADIRGLIVHDSRDFQFNLKDYIAAARMLNARLEAVPEGPLLFVEYAAGLEPDVFASFFESIASFPRVSACIDIGHVAIRQTRRAYAQRRPGEDVFDLKEKIAKIPEAMEDIQESLLDALRSVLSLFQKVGAFGKPVHFHLHDGHPLSTFSPFGVSDHLSFLAEIPLDFEYRGRRMAPPIFGPAGLAQVVSAALDTIGGASFTLEIHPVFKRLALDGFSQRFAHWRDKTNAEQMNHWLWTLEQNHALLLDCIASCLDNLKTR